MVNHNLLLLLRMCKKVKPNSYYHFFGKTILSRSSEVELGRPCQYSRSQHFLPMPTLQAQQKIHSIRIYFCCSKYEDLTKSFIPTHYESIISIKYGLVQTKLALKVVANQLLHEIESLLDINLL